MTLAEFKLKSAHFQVAHIDITKAPSYSLWAKASLASRKRIDSRNASNGRPNDHWQEENWNRKDKDLNLLGFDIVHTGGKAAEYAYVVLTELGLKHKLSRGTFKGCTFDVEELYTRLSK